MIHYHCNSALICKIIQLCMHNMHKCGKFWNNIPGLEQRAICPMCKKEEFMEHIPLECEAQGQKIIWNLTKELWLKKPPYIMSST